MPPTVSNTEFFLGGEGAGSSLKKCNHDCDQALIKQLVICTEYTYISELMLWLH